MKTTHQLFFRGPSLWSPVSGLRLIVDHGSETIQPLNWRPSEAVAASILSLLRDVFPVAVESPDLATPDAIRQAHAPLTELLLATTEVLIRDFCTQPAKGRLLAASPKQLQFFVPCDDPAIGSAAWGLSIKPANTVLSASAYNTLELVNQLKAAYRDFRLLARGNGLNQTAVALARTALKRDIPHYRLAPPGQFLQLGQGCHRKRIMETATDETSTLGRMIAGDKLATASLLAAQGIPTPWPRVVRSTEAALTAALQLGFPVVVKPRASGKGNGVAVGLLSDKEVALAFQEASKYRTGVLVERFIPGEDHRLLVVAGRFVAAAKRIPAAVTGDGKRSVRQLVEWINRDPRRGMPFERLLEWITLDNEAGELLAREGLDFDTVPEQGRTVFLRRTANLSRGGTSIDVTDRVHPDNQRLAERVARLIGLDVTGIDFMTPDIGRSWREGTCGILEVNSTPGLRPHLSSNPDRDVVMPIIDHLFPDGSTGRVPTAGITGSVGKTTTCTMVASILSSLGMTVARSTTQGAWVGEDPVRVGDVAGGAMARALLLDPRVEAGVFELARGGLIKHGMGLDAVDVGAVLNVYDNHIGLDGAGSREDLARAKRLVVQNALKMAVLNADDPLCLAMREHITAPIICLVSTQPRNPAVMKHLGSNGLAAYLDGDDSALELKLFQGSELIGTMPAAEIPATLGGRFRPAIHNALFATAIAFGMGVEPGLIRGALAKFHSTQDSNPGRMNFIENLPYQLLVTWADGREAIQELAGFVRSLAVAGKKNLLITAMGNRPDRYLIDMGKAAASVFDEYFCSDWTDLRGRTAGFVAQLLAQGLAEGGVPGQRISIAPSYENALEMAFAKCVQGDLLVVITFDSRSTVLAAQARANEPTRQPD